MREMRRKDREMNTEFALSIVDKVAYANITTMNEDGTPHTIPISIAREGMNVYMHSASSGSKVDNVKRSSMATMTFVGEVNVPSPIEKSEYEEAEKEGNIGKLLLSKKFTTEFESAVAFGRIYIVDNDEEKIKGLRLICEKYTPENMDYFDKAIEVSLDIVTVMRFEIDEIKGKRKKFDLKGEEMKWGRME